MPQYYQPPPSFQQPPSAHPMSPPPGPPIMHARSPSEVISPSMGHFSPNGAPPPPAAPYGHISPPIYSHPGHAPMGMQPLPLPPLPPLHQHSPHPHSGPQPHPNLYNSAASPVPPFPMHQDAPGPYPMPPPPANINFPEPVNGVKPDGAPAENYNNNTNHPNHREGLNAHRRGGPRRPSFNNSRKPPCLFFPAGRCKNGYVIFFFCMLLVRMLTCLLDFSEECRFPHILPENGAPIPHPVFPSSRPGPPRPRGQANGPNNNFPNLEAKLGNMSVRDVSRQSTSSSSHENLHQMDSYRTNLAKRTELKARADPIRVTRAIAPSSSKGGKHPAAVGVNGKKAQQAFRSQQRVPNPDEFPVLAGSTTPPIRTPAMNGFSGNGGVPNGPTAAQVLQAPPPPRKDSKESSTRGTTPDPGRGNLPKVNHNHDMSEAHVLTPIF